MKVFAATAYYLPGFRGGTIRALANIVRHMSATHDFHVVTGTCDVGQTQPYEGVTAARWQPVAGAQVYYLPRGPGSWRELRRLVREVDPDLLLLIGIFSSLSIQLLVLRRLGLLGRRTVLLAPEGELAAGALAQKSVKKVLFLRAASALGLYSGVHWKATNEVEPGDIRRWAGPSAQIHLVHEMAPPIPPAPMPPAPKVAGAARLLCLARISPVKNLHFLIERLRGLRGEITVDIIGPAEEDYLRTCMALAATLPSGITVRFLGEIRHELIDAEFVSRHFFVLPSLGESFGYAILEALASGRPALVSDRTPWRDLQRHQAGWTLSLDDPGGWHRALQDCIDMTADVYVTYVSGAHRLAQAYAENSERERAFNQACDAAVTAARM